MKTTADQVIKGFDALPSEQKRQVYQYIGTKFNAVNRFTGIRRVQAKALNTVVKAKCERNSYSSFRSLKYARGQKLLWKDILISFLPNDYVPGYEELWRLESVLGSDVVRDSLRKYRVLDANFVEHLFRKSTYAFYVNQTETYLFSDYGHISEENGGPLKQLTAFEAMQRYGLILLEESKEKQYVRL